MSRDPLESATDAARLHEAAGWYARHGSDAEPSPAATQAWDEWMSHAENSAEYDGVAKFVSDLRGISVPALRSDDEVRSDPFAPFDADLDGSVHSGVVETLEAAAANMSVRVRNHSPYFWAVAAAAFAVCVASALLLFGHRFWKHVVADPGDSYATGPGEHREFNLQDGSVVALAGNSSLLVQYTADLRTLVLERGEVLFRVGHNPRRPFVVLAGRGSITALGTEFDVRLNSNRVLVAVTEGSVEVAPRDSGSQSPSAEGRLIEEDGRWIPLRVAGGQEMAYDSKGEASAPKPTDAQAIAAWKKGSMEYRGRPLKEVIEDVQRYTSRRVLLDPAAADLQFSGIFVERDAEQWIHLLPRILPLDVVAEPGRILIRLRVQAAGSAAVDPER